MGEGTSRRWAERARTLVDRLGELEALDKPSKSVASLGQAMGSNAAVKNALSGTWLGHRVHPPLTDVVIGSWLSATILDLLGGPESRRAADRLVTAGALAAVPTASAGLSDYSDLYGHGRRVAFVHLLVVDTALVLQVASIVARRRGRRTTGVVLSLSGMGVATAAAWLGGHLSYVLGIGVDHTAFGTGPQEWTDVASSTEVSTQPLVVSAAGQDILLIRVDGQITALANTCGHAGGPLSEGGVEDGCVTCPWHGSVFRLSDGGVVRGPAASPQRGFDVREVAGRVEVRGRS